MTRCGEWRKHGLMPPQEGLAATANYRAEEDTIQRFINDECVVGTAPKFRGSRCVEARRSGRAEQAPPLQLGAL
jgi:hypothetical protein